VVVVTSARPLVAVNMGAGSHPVAQACPAACTGDMTAGLVDVLPAAQNPVAESEGELPNAWRHNLSYTERCGAFVMDAG
jgi:hypothetical protein